MIDTDKGIRQHPKLEKEHKEPDFGLDSYFLDMTPETWAIRQDLMSRIASNEDTAGDQGAAPTEWKGVFVTCLVDVARCLTKKLEEAGVHFGS